MKENETTANCWELTVVFLTEETMWLCSTLMDQLALYHRIHVNYEHNEQIVKKVDKDRDKETVSKHQVEHHHAHEPSIDSLEEISMSFLEVVVGT